MAKDPAILFYYQDFLVGTSFMTEPQVGAYIRILCHLYDKGSLSESHMLNICSSSDIWNSIKEKFRQDPDGYYFHPRAREEKQKRENFTDSRRKNRLKHSNDAADELSYEKDMKNTSSTSDDHMENGNEDINENVNSKESVDKNTPEGLIFRYWGKHSNNLNGGDRAYLDKVWKDSKFDPVLLRYAFSQSVKYGKKNFAYLEKIIQNQIEALEMKKIKQREIEAEQQKHKDSKEFKPDPETLTIFKEITESLSVRGKKIPKQEDYKSTAEYQKAKQEFERSVNQ